MIRSVSALVAIVGVAGTALPAAAQSVCAERDVIITKLQQDFSEQPSALGISDNGAVVEVLASKDGTTWTILMTMPDGVSCVIATGEAWERVPEQIAAIGNDA